MTLTQVVSQLEVLNILDRNAGGEELSAADRLFIKDVIKTLHERAEAWKKMAHDLYWWEHIEARNKWDEKWEGPRYHAPENFEEVSNHSGVNPHEWRQFVAKN